MPNVSPNKIKIIKTALRHIFLDKNLNITKSMIASEAGVSSGVISFFFPTKEDLFAEILSIMFKEQWKVLEASLEKKDPIVLYCLKTITIFYVCEKNDQIREFYIDLHSHTKTYNLLKYSDLTNSKKAFKKYCSNYRDLEYQHAENIVASMEYATIAKTNNNVPFDRRVRGVLNLILQIYNVPDDIREQSINRALRLDYEALANEVVVAIRKIYL